ncbi:heavy-metal-associated domain-containing protein [Tamlana sp. 2201CG12-4]|uniref:heavy-metal-associated domain-containing protein n=1 Tax=Tamlana sp. 2201CG12-4 TaxID=3112582 RepID=UPI002DBFA54C|nr:heavy-metal-associated domain-containing protein [Tamlana sp. 2201CG12-4]MEC3905572.1 heavy-metal-associated domain-containing protein [Tamlana sp. 2201CG12-4]
MKKVLVVLLALYGTVTLAQNKNAKASLEVDGVCLMCKTRIEKASLNTKGVKSAVWNVETHELKLIYDERKTNLETIQSKIIAVGHDTQELKATDEAYAKVHPCCRYRDQVVQDQHKESDEHKEKE